MVEESSNITVSVQSKIPFEMDAELRRLKRQTGLKIDRLVFLAIKRFLEEVAKGQVEAIRVLQKEDRWGTEEARDDRTC